MQRRKWRYHTAATGIITNDPAQWRDNVQHGERIET
jgi:hypothetical protein